MSIARKTLQVAALMCTLVVGAAAMAVIVTQTTWFKDWLRGFIVRQAKGYVNGEVRINRLDGNLLFGIEIEDVDVTMNGRKVVELKDVGIDYNFWTFISGDVVLDDIRLNKPVLRLAKDANGWNLMQLVKARTPDRQGGNRRPLEIGEIGISEATLYFEDGPEGTPVGTSGVNVPSVIEKLDASIGVTSDADALVFDIKHVSLRTREPRFGVNSLSGQITRTKDGIRFEKVALRTEESSLSLSGRVNTSPGKTPTVDLRVSSDKLSLQELSNVLPALRRYPFQPAFEIAATGPLDALNVDLRAREQTTGEIGGTLIVDAQTPGRRLAGTVALRHVNLGPILNTSRANSDIVGKATFDLALPEGRFPLSGTYSADIARATVGGYDATDVKASGRVAGRTIRLERARAAGYGGHATATGTILVGTPLRLDLRGHAVNVDMRETPPQLQIPGVPSRLEFDYTLAGRGSVFSGDVRFAESTLAEATIAPGTTATFTFGGGAPEYAGQGTIKNLDAQKIGRGFGVRLLEQDRFKSRISGTFTVTGSGGGRYPFSLDASGSMADSEIFGATVPRMNFSTQFANGDARVRAVGSFENLNPEVPTGNPRIAGSLTGTVDVDTTIRDYANGVTVDTFGAQGRVNLGRSEIARLTLDAAVVDGQYANREGQITQLSVSGPDLNATASGPIALNENGSSNVTLHVDTPSLDRIGEIIGRPLTGAAVIEATVTGNGRSLSATGALTGSNAGYGEHTALNLESTFRATVPNLTPADATVEANSHATFLEVAGRRINELTADTTYSKSNLVFTATAKEGTRELTADGTAVFHPDHQEVHLGNLGFASHGVAWRSVPGAEATVQYRRDRLVVERLQLVSGSQRIEAEGVVGSRAEALNVRASNVDIGQLDQLLLTNYGATGTLNAEATVRGLVRDPRIEGTFTLSPGTFKQFAFESFGGSVRYGGRGMTIDTRLQQTPAAWLTAKGYLPLAFFKRPGDGGAVNDHETLHEAPTPGDLVDVQIASNKIDLGVVQGFTQYVTNVTGAMQANVRLTGTVHDPHMTGTIHVQDGTFTVPDLGTAYTGFDTRIDLLPEKVNVREMRIVDQHKHEMTIGGSLGVHARAVGDVDITIKSREFEVIDNRTGDLKVDTDLRLTGDVRNPKLQGSVDVRYGTINVSDVVERATANPYSTEEAGAEALTPPTPTLLDRIDLTLGVGVPSSLVLKGSDIRTANASIGAGDINVTVGGAVQIRKAPAQKLRLVGEVNTVRGTYQFQGRRFNIMRDGRIRFSGTEELNPVLDIKAQRLISGIETFVFVRGTLDRPELTFSSNPPLDQADILSLIIFNQPASQLGEGQQASLAEQATALAGGYIAGGLVRSIGEALELDEFDLQASGESGLGPSLTVGEQVGERLFVKLRQGFGAEQATEFLVEYQINDFLRAQGAVAEIPGGTQRSMFRRVERGGLDLIFFFSY